MRPLRSARSGRRAGAAALLAAMIGASCGTSSADRPAPAGAARTRAAPETRAVEPRDEIPTEAPSEGAPSDGAPTHATLTLDQMSGCWLRPDRRVACWGAPGEGGHGDPSEGRLVPPETPHVVSWLEDVVQLDGFGDRRCAVTSGGAVHCFGHLFLGHAHVFSRAPPGDAVAMASGNVLGRTNPCALDAGGSIRCFESSPPDAGWRPVEGIESADAMALAGSLLCARLPDRRLACNSGDRRLQLGVVNGIADVAELTACGEARVCVREAEGRVHLVRHEAEGRREPVAEATEIGDASRLEGRCVIRAAGGVACSWGGRYRDLPGVEQATSVVTWGELACALTEDASVHCTRMSATRIPPAREVRALRGATSIALRPEEQGTRGGHEGLCGSVGGRVRCVRVRGERPADPPGPPMRARVIRSAGLELCGLHEGALDCWAPAALHERDRRYTPRVSDVTSIEMLGSLPCARRANGQRFCFRSFGIAELVPPGVARPGLPPTAEVSVGAGFACARGRDGGVRCWGVHGDQGQLGDGRGTWSTDPVRVAGVEAAVDVEAGDRSACAVDESGRVFCWGVVPDPTGMASGPNLEPTQLTELEDVVAVALSRARDGSLCARHRDGTVSCRGGRFHCDLPEGHQPLTAAARIPGVEGARAIEGGAGYFCALLERDRVACWGANVAAYDEGRRCGDPPTVFELPGARGLGLDGAWTCVDRGESGVWCWGRELPTRPFGSVGAPTALVPFPAP